MNSVINRTYEMFVRVQNFAAERASSFPADSLGGEQVAELRRVIETLTEAARTAPRATRTPEAARAPDAPPTCRLETEG